MKQATTMTTGVYVEQPGRRLIMFLLLLTAILMANKNHVLVLAVDMDGTATVSATANAINHGEALIDWVRSKGGHCSDKLEIRRMDPKDDESPFGVFATQDISPDERLLEVPKECYISLEMDDILEARNVYDNEDNTEENMMEFYYVKQCKLAQLLLREMELYQTNPDQSAYGPYMAYLLETQPMGQLPATYSKAGKALLRQIVGPIDTTVTPRNEYYGNFQLPPLQLVDWIEERFVETGCIDADNRWQEHAVALSTQRGFDTEFIPIWDMVNHDNGKLNTANSPIHSDEGIKVWAAQAIAAGDEIYATYNYCTDCMDVGDDWGTPGIYRDFGFVERPPQVWPFLDLDIYFEVIEDERKKKKNDDKDVKDNDTNKNDSSLRAAFDQYWPDSDEYNVVPNEEDEDYFQEQFTRLEDVERIILLEKDRGDVPKHELQMIIQFHQATQNALRLALEAIEEDRNKDDQEGEDADEDEYDEGDEYEEDDDEDEYDEEDEYEEDDDEEDDDEDEYDEDEEEDDEEEDDDEEDDDDDDGYEDEL